MLKRLVYFSLSLVILVASADLFAGCQSSRAFPPANSIDSSEPLSWLLHAVPPADNLLITYTDIPTLSAYQNQTIPSRQASMQEKIDWWATFQRYVLGGVPFSGLPEIWGFDEVDLEGILDYWYSGSPRVTILGGHLDTDAFREKMKSYGYAEESYLGFTVFFGIPQNVINTYPSLSNLLPRAYGVIQGVEVKEDSFNLILMADNWNGNIDVLQSKNSIEAALKAYQEKTAIGFKTDEISALTNSLGEVGSAFILNKSEFERMYQGLSAEGRDRVKSNVAPIDLGTYNAVAITFKKSGIDSILEFVLAYDHSAEAKSNLEALRTRVTEGHSAAMSKTLTGLNGLWTVRGVEAQGRFLRATVKVNEVNGKAVTSIVGLLWMPDFYFLYPNPE